MPDLMTEADAEAADSLPATTAPATLSQATVRAGDLADRGLTSYLGSSQKVPAESVKAASDAGDSAATASSSPLPSLPSPGAPVAQPAAPSAPAAAAIPGLDGETTSPPASDPAADYAAAREKAGQSLVDTHGKLSALGFQPSEDSLIEPGKLRAHVDASINAALADPAANENAKFGPSRFTPEAQKIRDNLEALRAQAGNVIGDHASALGALRTSAAAMQAAQTAAAAAAAATPVSAPVIPGLGVDAVQAAPVIPGMDTPPAAAIPGPAAGGAGAPPATAEDAILQPTAERHWTESQITAAKAGQKPYSIDAKGQFGLSESRPLESLTEAVRDGVIANPPAEVWKAAADKQALVEAAGSNPKIKAALAGAGRGAAFLATAPIGAGIGGAALSETGVGAPIGALVGGIISGSVGAWGYGKIVEALAAHNDTINSFVASQQLHPGYSALGELSTFGAGMPRALVKGAGEGLSRIADALASKSNVPGATTDAIRASINAADMAKKAGVSITPAVERDAYSRAASALDAIGKSYASSGGGLVQTVENFNSLAKVAAARGDSAGAIAAAIGKRVATGAAAMVAIDTVLKEGSKALGLSGEGQTLGGAGTALLLGAMASGHGIAPKGYDNTALGNLFIRGIAHDATGTAMGEKVDLAKLANLPGVLSHVTDEMTHPLTPEEHEIYDAFSKKALQLIGEGKIAADSGQWQANAQQILFAGRKGGIASVDIQPKERKVKGRTVGEEPPPVAPQSGETGLAQPGTGSTSGAPSVQPPLAQSGVLSPAPSDTLPSPPAGPPLQPPSAHVAPGVVSPANGQGGSSPSSTPVLPDKQEPGSGTFPEPLPEGVGAVTRIVRFPNGEHARVFPGKSITGRDVFYVQTEDEAARGIKGGQVNSLKDVASTLRSKARVKGGGVDGDFSDVFSGESTTEEPPTTAPETAPADAKAEELPPPTAESPETAEVSDAGTAPLQEGAPLQEQLAQARQEAADREAMVGQYFREGNKVAHAFAQKEATDARNRVAVLEGQLSAAPAAQPLSPGTAGEASGSGGNTGTRGAGSVPGELTQGGTDGLNAETQRRGGEAAEELTNSVQTPGVQTSAAIPGPEQSAVPSGEHRSVTVGDRVRPSDEIQSPQGAWSRVPRALVGSRYDGAAPLRRLASEGALPTRPAPGAPAIPGLDNEVGSAVDLAHEPRQSEPGAKRGAVVPGGAGEAGLAAGGGREGESGGEKLRSGSGTTANEVAPGAHAEVGPAGETAAGGQHGGVTPVPATREERIAQALPHQPAPEAITAQVRAFENSAAFQELKARGYHFVERAGDTPAFETSMDGSKRILFNPEVARQWMAIIEADGGDPIAWMIDGVMPHETLHGKQIEAHPEQFKDFYGKLAKVLGPERLKLVRRVYAGSPEHAPVISPAVLAAEYERMLWEAGGKLTEEHEGGDANLQNAIAALRKVLKATQPPEVNKSLAAVRRIGVARPMRFGRFDPFFDEDPIVQFISNQGGLLSATQARQRWLRAGVAGAEKWAANKGEWDDAPGKLAHPTHNHIYQPNGLQPDEMVNALIEGHLLPEGATVADLWRKVWQASESANRMRQQDLARRKEEGRQMKEGGAKPAEPMEPFAGKPGPRGEGDLTAGAKGGKLQRDAITGAYTELTGRAVDPETAGRISARNEEIVGAVGKLVQDALAGAADGSAVRAITPAEWSRALDQPELSDDTRARLQAMDWQGWPGGEGLVVGNAEHAYKIYEPKDDAGKGIGIIGVLQRGADGKLSIEYQRGNVADVVEKASVLSHLGVPTEIVGFHGPSGELVTKQPLAEAISGHGKIIVDLDQWGAVPVPVASGEYGTWMVKVGGRDYLVSDLKQANVMGNTRGDARPVDIVLTPLSEADFAAHPELAEARKEVRPLEPDQLFAGKPGPRSIPGLDDLFEGAGAGNTASTANVSNEEAGTLVRMGGQVVAKLRKATSGYFVPDFNAHGQALTTPQKAEVNRAAMAYSKQVQAAKVREGQGRRLEGGEVRSQGDLLDSSKAEDPLFHSAAGRTASPAKPSSDQGMLLAGKPGPRQEDEPFYSQLTRMIEALPQETMTVGQARAAITKGAKPAEIAQQGILDDPLSPLAGKQPGDKVSKSDMLGYALERQATVQDVVLGGDTLTPKERQRLFLLDTAENQRYLTNEEIEEQDTLRQKSVIEEDQEGKLTHFSQYQLPGADPDSYREMFVTWPERTATQEQANKRLKEIVDAAMKRGGYAPGELEEADKLSKIAQNVRGDEAMPVSESWRDGHSQYKDIANPIVRIRRNIRTDSEGRKTYFIEEMQGPSSAEQAKMPPELRKRIYEIGMKRAIRDAIDEGADAIGWTTGEQQAERYDLSKQITKIAWKHTAPPAGTPDFMKGQEFRLDVTDKNGALHSIEVDGKDVESHIGKELAEQIKKSVNAGQNTGNFSGLSLKVGGEGLKNLYDTMLPRIANKLAEKVGGKVGSSALRTDELGGIQSVVDNDDGAWVVTMEDGKKFTYDQGEYSKGAAKEAAIEATQDDRSIHSMPLPDAWKQEAPSFALFAGKPGPRDVQDLAHGDVKQPGFADKARAMLQAAAAHSGWDSLVDDVQRALAPDARLTPEELDKVRRYGSLSSIPQARAASMMLDGMTAAMDRRKRQFQAALLGSKRLIDTLPSGLQRELTLQMDESGRENGQNIQHPTSNIAPTAPRASRKASAQHPMDDMIPGLETGSGAAPLQGDAARVAEVMGKILPELRKLDAEKLDDVKAAFDKLGLTHWRNYENYLKNIIPHAFEDEAVANKVLDSMVRRRKIIGGTGWLKHREGFTLRDILERAKEMGVNLKLRHENPVEAVMARWSQQDRFIGALQLMHDLEAAGLGHWETTEYSGREGERMINNIAGQRTKDIEGVPRKQNFWASDQVATLINNYLSRGLRQNRKWVEHYFTAANVLNGVQLGISAFHAGFVTMEGMVSELARGLQEMMGGEVGKGAKTALHAPVSTIGNYRFGRRVQQELLKPGMHPDLSKVVDEIVAAGFRHGVDSFYQDQHLEEFWKAAKALANGKPTLGLLRAPLALIEALAKPIMEHYVPNMKAAAVYKLAEMHLRQNPNLSATALRKKLQESVRSGNNRFGQMTYDNLHLHKTVKDLLMMLTRSLGWNWGTFAEIGGGVADWVKYPAQWAKHWGEKAQRGAGGQKGAPPPEITNRMAYTLALPLLVGLFGAALSAMFGQRPKELKDYYFIKTGGTDEQGNPERIVLPSYMKDVFHAAREPGSTITNKLHPLLSTVAAMLQNKDFYGVRIRNPGDPLYRQALSELGYFGKQFVPFTARNTQKALRQGSSPAVTVAGMLGISQAPAGATKTDAQYLADKLNAEKLPRGSRTQEQADHSTEKAHIIGLMRANPAKGMAAFNAAVAAGTLSPADLKTMQNRASLSKLQDSANRLSGEELARVYEVATPAEKRELQVIMDRKAGFAAKKAAQLARRPAGATGYVPR